MKNKIIQQRKNAMLIAIGQGCQEFRRNVLALTQEDVAKRIGMSSMIISAFEKGRTDSAYIYNYYVGMGFEPWKYGIYSINGGTICK